MTNSVNPHCVFTTEVRAKDGSFFIEVPEREVSLGDIEVGEVYRLAVLRSIQSSEGPSEPTQRLQDSEPPVAVGETLEVEIEDIGSKGDGVARIGGYVIFVPNTTLRERVRIEIEEARENMAFGEVIGRLDPDS